MSGPEWNRFLRGAFYGLQAGSAVTCVHHQWWAGAVFFVMIAFQWQTQEIINAIRRTPPQ